ncbi:HEAT repeat domain-containing protein [Mucilaginibacter sp. UYCu711]|uniref:HEAT repeat domain-containing protein n=1 Tax=Mucilaginibacter sp. UYCu711 TaxID=3156339 RepID=UPI003D23FC3A
MADHQEFYRLIDISYFQILALLFSGMTVGIIVATYLFLYLKRRKFNSQQEMSYRLNEWISKIMIKEPQEELENYITPELLIYLKKRNRREFAIKQLINVDINLAGSAEKNMVQLYLRLNLKKNSLKKFYSRKWNIKATGIYELYMMEQADMQDEIFLDTNHPNEFVRMEAQIAMISFQGFKGLNFLTDLTMPLNNWRQIKLLDELARFTPTIMEDVPVWLLSKNDYVTLFALRLIEIYRQAGVHDIVVSLLNHKNQKIKIQAICTLGSIALEGTNLILKEIYVKEDPECKRQILKTLRGTQKNEDLSFFISKASEDDDLLKLESIRAIISNYKNGEHIASGLSSDGRVPKTMINQAIYESNH